eukprot:scaffold259_cov118-Isochrysis_galbana.AAC.5
MGETAQDQPRSTPASRPAPPLLLLPPTSYREVDQGLPGEISVKGPGGRRILSLYPFQAQFLHAWLYEDRACEGDFIVSARWRGGWAATCPDWFRLPLVVFNPVSFSFPGRDPIPHEEVHVWREAWRVYVLNAVYEGSLSLGLALS